MVWEASLEAMEGWEAQVDWESLLIAIWEILEKVELVEMVETVEMVEMALPVLAFLFMKTLLVLPLPNPT